MWGVASVARAAAAPADTLPPARNLQTEALLHPADAFTAYTLRRGEWVYNQSPFTLPLPSWAWWGITDRLTAELDLLPLVGGLFQEPHLPVPSFNLRYALRPARPGRRWALAGEIMFQHLWRAQSQADLAGLYVERGAGSTGGFAHLNASARLGARLHVHAAAGLGYTERLRLVAREAGVDVAELYLPRTVNPDLSLALDWRWRPGVSLHATASYGNTFVYLDNVPRKAQLCYGFRVAPFHRHRYGLLRTLRAEFVGFVVAFPDVERRLVSALPVFPYVYWQFGGRRRARG